jgi:hypothetical protein
MIINLAYSSLLYHRGHRLGTSVCSRNRAPLPTAQVQLYTAFRESQALLPIEALCSEHCSIGSSTGCSHLVSTALCGLALEAAAIPQGCCVGHVRFWIIVRPSIVCSSQG